MLTQVCSGGGGNDPHRGSSEKGGRRLRRGTRNIRNSSTSLMKGGLVSRGSLDVGVAVLGRGGSVD